MYPARALSIYDGWNILNNQKPEVLEAIEETLLEIPSILSGERQTAKQMASLGGAPIKLKDSPEVWQELFYKRISWSEDAFEIGYRMRGDYENARNASFKSRVLIKMVSEISEINLSKTIFIDAPKYKRDKICDLVVLLVPENGVLKLFGDPKELVFEFPFTESTCRRQLDAFLPLPYGSPLVIVFFSQFKRSQRISIQELPTLLEENVSESIIERSLEFAPEYTQAGISVLSYFSEVLRQKYPDLKVKVRIEQQGTTVLMHVELPSGDIDTIKEELATYFLVVAGKEKPEALLNNPYHVMALENKLQIANMELRMSHQLNIQLNRDIEGLNISQQRMEDTFREQIAEQGLQIRTLINLATQQSAGHERIQLAQIGHAGTMFNGLLAQAHGNHAALMAIRSLEHNLMSGIALVDIQEQLSTSLATIKQEKPSLLQHLAGQVEGAGFGAVGGVVIDWIGKHV